MASRGQSVTVTYVAWDTNLNSPKTGDVLNHTLRWVKDGSSSAPTNSASEVDSTNAPGVCKITLTGSETTCDVGTLAGKSSTANVVIIPLTITFELLPTYALGTNGAVATIDGTGCVNSNMLRINGQLSNGNNATLSLKSLDIQNSTGTAVIMKSTGSNGKGLDIAGHGTGNGMHVVGGTNASGNGSNGLYVKGGDGSNLNSGGIGFYSVGGSVPSTGSGGIGMKAEGGSGSSWGTGFYIISTYGTACTMYTSQGTGLIVQGYSGVSINGSILGLNIYSPDGNAAQFRTDTGDYSLALDGPTLGLGITRPKKNIALDNFMFPMFNSTTKVPMGGLSVTAQRAIDGNVFSPCSNGVSEISNGTYRISLSADDMNGDKIMLRFTATGADDQLIEILTQD